VLTSLESSEFSGLLRSELWGWPLVLTLHVLGTAVVVGFIIIISLRLLGLFETISFSSLNRLFPVVWAAIVVQVLTGVALWMTKPTRYVADTAFVLKTLLVFIGIVMTVYFYATLRREAASWDASGSVPAKSVKFAAASLLVWCGVVVAGRLTAHLGALYTG
jgi:hypothetical protein